MLCVLLQCLLEVFNLPDYRVLELLQVLLDLPVMLGYFVLEHAPIRAGNVPGVVVQELVQ